ncbi:MAG: glutamate 5-kinase [Parvibaculaceae bacterium]
MSSRLEQARRVVVKIGSALLVDNETGKLNRPWLDALMDDIAAMRKNGQDVVIVSSGAIALGRRALGLPAGSLKLEESQAAAAAGQIHLAHAFQAALAERNLSTAQVLVTLDDTEQRRRYLNARSTVTTLLKLGAVPVINENDTVATSEIRYGDNDRLAARVASMISADCLVLLSDIDGLYSAPPGEQGAHHIPEVAHITAEIEAMAGDAGSDLSRGGMKTKITAARIATQSGCHMVIASGHMHHPLRAINEGAKCTWFDAHSDPAAARKRWIAGALQPSGILTVDDGAAKALTEGRSLLPAGVSNVHGSFQRGDAVLVKNRAGEEIARGLSAYNSADAAAIAGHNSSEIEALLGYRGRTEMVHRDDLVLKKLQKTETAGTAKEPGTTKEEG